MWACEGFKNSVGVNDNYPFILKGNKQQYYWKDFYKTNVIKFVGFSLSPKYRMYVDNSGSKIYDPRAYYIRDDSGSGFKTFDDNKLTIRRYSWNSFVESTCIKQ